MADTFSTISENNLFKAVGDYITSLVSCEVVEAQNNRVPMPKGSFVAMTMLNLIPLETNSHTVTAVTESILTPSQMTMQIDCYGVQSGERAQSISSLFRDDYACQMFKDSGLDIQPFYASNPRQMPLVNGEGQYERRWTFNLEMQVNHSITLTAETAGMLAIGTPPDGQQIGTVSINSDGINKVD